MRKTIFMLFACLAVAVPTDSLAGTTVRPTATPVLPQVLSDAMLIQDVDTWRWVNAILSLSDGRLLLAGSSSDRAYALCADPTTQEIAYTLHTGEVHAYYSTALSLPNGETALLRRETDGITIDRVDGAGTMLSETPLDVHPWEVDLFLTCGDTFIGWRGARNHAGLPPAFLPVRDGDIDVIEADARLAHFLPTELLPLEDGGYLLCGGIRHTGDGEPHGRMPSLARLREDFSVQWHLSLPDEPSGMLYNAIALPDGGFLAVGFTADVDERIAEGLALWVSEEGAVHARHTINREAGGTLSSLALVEDTAYTLGVAPAGTALHLDRLDIKDGIQPIMTIPFGTTESFTAIALLPSEDGLWLVLDRMQSMSGVNTAWIKSIPFADLQEPPS